MSKKLPKFSIIAAVDQNFGLGYKNGLLIKLKSDLEYFKNITIGQGNNAIIMGKNTWFGLPANKKPLPKRLNIVLSKQNLDLPNKVKQFNSFEKSLSYAKSQNISEIFIIGGAELYQEAIKNPNCEKIHLTLILAELEHDLKFPSIPNYFKLVKERELKENSFKYKILEYKKKPASVEDAGG